jgi:hypothetical protein
METGEEPLVRLSCIIAVAAGLVVTGCTGSPEAGYDYRNQYNRIGYRPERQDEDYEGFGDERGGLGQGFIR